jgi:hypothetical protein
LINVSAVTTLYEWPGKGLTLISSPGELVSVMNELLYLSGLLFWLGLISAAIVFVIPIAWNAVWNASRCAIFTMRVRKAIGYKTSVSFGERGRANIKMFRLFWRNPERAVIVDGSKIDWPWRKFGYH